MEIGIGWIIFAILTAWYASGRGRSFVGYFLLSLLLSPLIGFLVAAVAGPSESGAVSRGLARKCPQCAELVKPEATICRYCRAPLTQLAPAPESAGVGLLGWCIAAAFTAVLILFFFH